jgi:hypothetical protein
LVIDKLSAQQGADHDRADRSRLVPLRHRVLVDGAAIGQIKLLASSHTPRELLLHSR